MVQLLTFLYLLSFWGYQNVLSEKYEEQHVKVKGAVAKGSASWKAKVNPDWVGKSVEDLKQLVGLQSGWETQGKELKSKETPEERDKDAAVRAKVQPLKGKGKGQGKGNGKGQGRRRRQLSALPQEFDWRDWTYCPSLFQIGDQQQCGYCWMLCWRISAKSVRLLREKGFGYGGDPYVPEEPAGCVPYPKVMSDQYLNKCPATCRDGRRLDSEKGVYHYTWGNVVGGHAVRMIGWGIENGKPYWLLANQWRSTWGEQGYFKMARGRNECNIEKVVASSLPLNALG